MESQDAGNTNRGDGQGEESRDADQSRVEALRCDRFGTHVRKRGHVQRHSGFGIDNDLYLYPSDTQALETLSRYIVRCPVSRQRLHYDKKSNYVLYQPKSKNRKAELLDPLEFLARVLIHIPQPNQHSILYYGHYARRRRKHTLLLASLVGVSQDLAAIGLRVFPVVILGGLDSLAGAVVGGAVIGLVEAYTGGYVGMGIQRLAPFVVLILILMVRP